VLHAASERQEKSQRSVRNERERPGRDFQVIESQSLRQVSGNVQHVENDSEIF